MYYENGKEQLNLCILYALTVLFCVFRFYEYCIVFFTMYKMVVTKTNWQGCHNKKCLIFASKIEQM